jgi:hypothetical protein
MDATRRRLLSGCGAACAVLLAGCSSDGPDRTATPTATPPPESASVTDGTVEYPGMVDGAARVNPDGTDYTIDYTDPEQSFALVSGFEGESNPSELRVSRDLSVDARAAFVAPIYDADAGAFVYTVFANAAFVQYADWHAVNLEPDGSISGEGALEFERAERTVYAADVEPGAVSRLFVVDVDADTFKEEDTGDLSGIVVLQFTRSEGTTTPAPTGTRGSTPTVTRTSTS